MKTTTYRIQECHRGDWGNWGNVTFDKLRDARSSLRFYQREYPHTVFRIVRLTTTAEVVA